MAKLFREAFCSCFNCSPEAYSREVLTRCLYPQARPLWKVFDLIGGQAHLAAKRLVELAGQTRSQEDLLDVIHEYRNDIKPRGGFLCNNCKMRISVERLVELHAAVRRREASATAEANGFTLSAG